MLRIKRVLVIIGTVALAGAFLWGSSAIQAGGSAVRAAGTLYYVDANAPGTPDGLSWDTAFITLQDALAAAGSEDEIWVAQGVYYPDEGAGQTDNAPASTFALKDGLAIYGGFAGGESSLGQRNWETHPTVLSGDLQGDDTTDGNSIVQAVSDIHGENAYHVVSSNSVTNSAVLDGFTVTAGQADGTSSPQSWGGGMLNEKSSPTVRHVVFSGNDAGISGGGMYNNNGSNPTLEYLTFTGNHADSYGGGITNSFSTPSIAHVDFIGNSTEGFGGGVFDEHSEITFLLCTFKDNTASSGAGLYSMGDTQEINGTTFAGNIASGDGGGIYSENAPLHIAGAAFQENSAVDGAGIYHYGYMLAMSDSSLSGNTASSKGGGLYHRIDKSGYASQITGSTFDGNSAQQGGGLFNYAGSSITSLILINSTLSSNTATDGGGIYNLSSTSSQSQAKVRVEHTTITANSASGSGGGVRLVRTAPAQVSRISFKNSLIADQSVGADCAKDATSEIVTNKYNLDSDDTCLFTDATDLPDSEPSLGPLQYNGGFTRTHALLTGSPAINAVPFETNGCGDFYDTDQRGESRPFPAGGACDIGAFEFRNLIHLPLIFK